MCAPPAPPTRRRARTTRAPAFVPRARGSPPLSMRPTSFSSPRSPAGSWSWRPCPRSASISTVHAPMPGSRAASPAALGLGACRSTRPPATSRAARRSAIARAPLSSRPPTSPAPSPETAALGRSRSPLVRPSPLAPAPSQRERPACSDRGGALVLDQLLAHRPHQRLQRLGPATHRSHGRRRSEPPISRSRSNRRGTRSDRHRRPARSASAQCRGRLPPASARAPNTTRSGAFARPGPRPAAPRVQQAFDHVRHAGAAPHPTPTSAQPERARPGEPPRAARTVARPAHARRARDAQSPPPSRCTSTSSERVPRICTSSPAWSCRALPGVTSEPGRRRELATAGWRWRSRGRLQAAPATKPVAATAAACRPGSGGPWISNRSTGARQTVGAKRHRVSVSTGSPSISSIAVMAFVWPHCAGATSCGRRDVHSRAKCRRRAALPEERPLRLRAPARTRDSGV